MDFDGDRHGRAPQFGGVQSRAWLCRLSIDLFSLGRGRPMARTDNDTWDLATGVGATATGVAVGRALAASRGADPLINDPFAEPLVRAVGVDFSPDSPAANWILRTSTTATLL